MSGFRRALAIFCLVAVVLAALAIVPAYGLLAWVLVAASLLLNTLQCARVAARRIDRALPDRAPLARLAPRAPPCLA